MLSHRKPVRQTEVAAGPLPDSLVDVARRLIAGGAAGLRRGLFGLVLLGLVQPALAASDGLQRWEGAALSAAGPATRIDVTGRPGGVLFKRDIQPTLQYQLVVSGRGDAFTMRLSRSTEPGQYTYHHAPQGLIALPITGTAHVEVLIYSDAPGAYTVDEISLRSCTACAMEMRSWESPRLTRSNGALQLSVSGAPGGTLYSQALDPGRRYRLRVAGRGDRLAMRIRTRGEKGETIDYRPAPQGEATLNFDGISSVEVLIYADSQAEYAIRAVRVDECENCQVSDDLVREVRKAIPDLDGMGDYQKAVAIMRWAAAAANYTNDLALTPPDFEAWPADRQYFEFFRPLAGGVSCGGMAVFAANVMRLFDIDAMTINYGVPPPRGTYATHVSVVARIGSDYYLMDPTFSATIESDSGPVPFDRALVAVVRQPDAIRVEDAELSGRANIGPETTKVRGICDRRSVSAQDIDICRLGPNRSFLDHFGESQRDLWRSEGVELERNSLVSLVWRGVFSVEGGLTPDSNDRLVERLKSIGVPFHN
jgi:hypothetical protein